MDVKWIGFVVALWVLLIILGATFDAQSSEASTWGLENEDTLTYLTDVSKITYAEGETGSFAWVTPNTEYFDAFYTLISWNFGFLKCPDVSPGCGYAYFRYIALIPFSIVALFGIFIIFVTLLQGFIPG